MATKSDFTVKAGIRVSNNITLSNTSGISANGSLGSNSQVLTSNGSAVYWSSPVSTGKAIAMAIVFGG